ncbi:MAG TPA: Sua5/YciO/YrdC/YwlC family protein, partial [Planctomycetaceae bacterium]
MPEIIDIRTCDDPRDEIHRVVERLAVGELVGLPTETSYVLAAQASQAAAVSRLREAADGPLVMTVRSADEALDFAPGVDETG